MTFPLSLAFPGFWVTGAPIITGAPTRPQVLWGEEPQRNERAFPPGGGSEGCGACGDEGAPSGAYKRFDTVKTLAQAEFISAEH